MDKKASNKHHHSDTSYENGITEQAPAVDAYSDAQAPEPATDVPAEEAPTNTTKYAIEENVSFVTDRSALRTDRLLDTTPINKLAIGQSFLIPLIAGTRKGKAVMVPEIGVNIKSVNKMLAPKTFIKKKELDKSKKQIGVRIGRSG